MMKKWQNPRSMRFIIALVSQELKTCQGCIRGVAILWNVSYWPEADELDDAICRQLSRLHRTCCAAARAALDADGAAEIVR
jgi:hypothetical protein